MLLLALSMVETAEEAAKLTRLYELYSTEMYHAAKNILRNHHDAEDAMQNAFVQLIRLLDHIKDPESPSTRAYVISAVQSRATDLYRYKQRRRVVSLDELEALSVPPALPDVPGMSDIDRAIAMLPANYRQVVLLRYLWGFSNQEVCRILNMSDANVKKTVQRAKTKLEHIIAEWEADSK